MEMHIQLRFVLSCKRPFARVVKYCEIEIPVSAFQGPRIDNDLLSETSVMHHEADSKMGQRVYTLSLIPIYPGPLR